MKAYLKNYRQSPRKVRLVANLIRGKSVSKAQALLSFTDNKSASALKKLVDSAMSNARSTGRDLSKMIVKEITVDQGITMKRIRPMSRGRANQFRKRSSKVSIVLGEMETKTAKGSMSLSHAAEHQADHSVKQTGFGKKENRPVTKDKSVKKSTSQVKEKKVESIARKKVSKN